MNRLESGKWRYGHAVALAVALIAAFVIGRKRTFQLGLPDETKNVAPAAISSTEAELLGDGAIELSRGFFPNERAPDGRVSRWMGGRALITLRHFDSHMTLSITGWAPRKDNQPPTTVQLKLDDRELDRFEAPLGPFTRTFDIKGLSSHAGRHWLRIEVSRTIVSPPDPRHLGFNLEDITWTTGAPPRANAGDDSGVGTRD